MIYISHRGNINGPNKKLENNPNYIKDAIKKGFSVEVDVNFKNNNFYLGHDKGQYKVSKKFLINKKIWCHAKSIEAALMLKKIKAHYFWHQNDDITLTSKGYFWTYPGKKLTKISICVLPEWTNSKKFNCAGICSDFISKYKE
tara:strand:- start:109 stop:537 length:429 start_codon:yes stop_codon:yes gene_type:complete